VSTRRTDYETDAESQKNCRTAEGRKFQHFVDRKLTAKKIGMLLAYKKQGMEKETDIYIDESMKLAEKLEEVSEKGQAASSDRGCEVLFGIVRDCAYSILKRAELEREVHMNTGAGVE
jgi:hypothetical protein